MFFLIFIFFELEEILNSQKKKSKCMSHDKYRESFSGHHTQAIASVNSVTTVSVTIVSTSATIFAVSTPYLTTRHPSCLVLASILLSCSPLVDLSKYAKCGILKVPLGNSFSKNLKRRLEFFCHTENTIFTSRQIQQVVKVLEQ